MQLSAYGDDSGLHEQAKYCLILGYIAAPLQWNRFNELWRVTLSHYRIDEFHSIQFFPRLRRLSRTDPYRDWSDEKRIELLDTLLGIRAHCRLVPIGWAVDIAAFRALSHEQRRYFTGGYLWSHWRIEREKDRRFRTTHFRRTFKTSGAPNQPYMAAFNLFLADAHYMATDEAGIHVVFDIQRAVQSGAIQHFNKSWREGSKTNPKKFLSIKYIGSEDEPALQLADLYAYAWARYLNRHPMTEELRHAMRKLTRLKKHLNIADAAHFQQLWKELQKDLAAENVIGSIRDERLEANERSNALRIGKIGSNIRYY